jgi:hypothetical protein
MQGKLTLIKDLLENNIYIKGHIIVIYGLSKKGCRENIERIDGAEPRTGPFGAVKPTEGRLIQEHFKIIDFERNVSFSTIVFFEIATDNTKYFIYFLLYNVKVFCGF